MRTEKDGQINQLNEARALRLSHAHKDNTRQCNSMRNETKTFGLGLAVKSM